MEYWTFCNNKYFVGKGIATATATSGFFYTFTLLNIINFFNFMKLATHRILVILCIEDLSFKD